MDKNCSQEDFVNYCKLFVNSVRKHSRELNISKNIAIVDMYNVLKEKASTLNVSIDSFPLLAMDAEDVVQILSFVNTLLEIYPHATPNELSQSFSIPIEIVNVVIELTRGEINEGSCIK